MSSPSNPTISQINFIDFQGGRKGPLQYDLASLLFESKIDLSNELRETLLRYYVEVFERKYSWFQGSDFLVYYYPFVYLRLMQAMGAYGFRGLVEHKPLFLQSLPKALETLSWLIVNHPLPIRLKSLPGIFNQLIHHTHLPVVPSFPDKLTVVISSFSYKSGIPADTSGNGGGFVFDCRSIHNPGRVEAFQHLTGRDEAVIRFLDSQEDAQVFFNYTARIADMAVENYLRRNFTRLVINYGCTGGRHRSVYMTEHLADRLRNKYDIQVVVNHTEIEK